MKVLRTFPTLDKAHAYFKYLRSVRGDRYSVHDYSAYDRDNPWAVSEMTFDSAYVLFRMWLEDAVSRMQEYPQ